MPYKFLFKIHDEIHFEADMESHQCEHTRDGRQCRRKVVIGYTYCFSHLLERKKLRIKESTLGNFLGLFAQDKLNPTDNNILFRKDDVITEYIGEKIDEDELNQRYDIHTAPYSVQLNDDEYVDSALRRGAGSLANRGDARTNNAKLVASRNKIRIIAMKNIRNGSEILINYGKDYIMNEENVSFKTKK